VFQRFVRTGVRYGGWKGRQGGNAGWACRARTGRLTARRSCALGTSYSASLVSMTLLRLSAHATSLISFLSGACRQVCSRTPEG